jgi:hypothetical protein
MKRNNKEAAVKHNIHAKGLGDVSLFMQGY